MSWPCILRINSLTLLIRKHPLGKVIAQARLGSECLWRLTDLRALNELDALVRRMWGRGGKTAGKWQVSQVHLAVDVANAPIEVEQPPCYVSRSRRQAIYEAARSEVERLTRDLYGDTSGGELPFTVDWDAEFAEDDDTYIVLDWDASREEDGEHYHLVSGHLSKSEPLPIEDRAVTLFRTHQRLSGVTRSPGHQVTRSPGGAISLVQYNKRRQGVVSGKRHMEPIWKASEGGWEPEEGATRHEVRMRREAIRELGLLDELRSCLDDPWEFLDHKQDVFAAVVGRPETEACPDASTACWIRLAVPDDHDSNRSRRSRWFTDPLWRVVQSASFSLAPASARRLIRRKQQLRDVTRLDAGMYGYLVSRVAHAHPNGGQYDVSKALGETQRALQKEASKPGKDFGELVRERRRRCGLPNPPAGKLLPFRWSPFAAQRLETPVTTTEQERAPASSGPAFGAFKQRFDPPDLAVQTAELRMQEALDALETAALRGAKSSELETLEAAFLSAELAYITVSLRGQTNQGAQASVDLP